ncbi:C2 domain-containing protein [Lactarius akahatsu]|uniref:C2 domain-containing protein n=1 Tax=Lactarius akahatsu TaxID=416441 RepID=A0AAD4Q8R3_9AGAM|nr:C2 domain-containing protein [Lactarius akahatsu]KAH8981405.1 C2 domain-containing protein [Lactarius akahatsu]
MSVFTTPLPSSFHTPLLRRGNIGETPLVILRVQVISCQDLEAKDRNGLSDPFVVVSLLGKQFQTPVCKRTTNPVYELINATFDFPIYTSLVHKLGMLKFVVWDKDIGKDFMGEYSLPIDRWFKGTFAFNDPNNEPFSVNLISSSPPTARGTIRFKLGFYHPPGWMGLPDFERVYNALMSVLAPTIDTVYIGVVILEICGANDLPKWSNMTCTGWDMDPFVQVSIGNEVARTRIVRHSLNPIWDERLKLHVLKQNPSLPMRLTVFDCKKFTSNRVVGEAEIDIATLVESSGKKDPDTRFYPDNAPTTHEFELFHLTKNPKRSYQTTPTITFRVSYQSYDKLRKVGQRV